MSELNLTHSNGNKVKLTTPDTLAANKTFKLPGIDGSSRDILTTNGSGALSFSKPGLTLIETKEVASGSASATAFHFNNCFSSTYDFYTIKFNLLRTGTSGNAFFVQFGSAGNGSVITSNYYARGSMRHNKLGTSSNSGEHHYISSAGYFQLMSSIGGDANSGFRGTMDIIDPQSNMVSIIGQGIMHYGLNNGEKYVEDFGTSADMGERSGLTDIRLIMADGSGGGSNITSTTAVAVYGRVSIFGANQ